MLRWKKQPTSTFGRVAIDDTAFKFYVYSIASTSRPGVPKNSTCHINVLRGEAKVELRPNLAVNADVLPFTLKALKNAFFSIHPSIFLASDCYCTWNARCDMNNHVRHRQ